MANPIANPPSLGVKLTIAGSPLTSSASVQNACVDGTGSYAYLAIKWAGTVTVNSTGSQVLPVATFNAGTSPVTANFPTTGYFVVSSDAGLQLIHYTGLTASTFTGCTGGTGTVATGTACSPPGQLAQVKLADMTLQNAWWSVFTSPRYLSVAYDAANAQIVGVMSDSTVWITPVVAGSPPSAGTAVQVSVAITNVAAGNMGQFTGGLVYDAVAGFMWQSTQQVKQIFGFAYKHATIADYTAITHNVEPGQAIGNSHPGCYGIASYKGGQRFAFCMAANTNGALYNIVGRWRQDQGRIEVLADGNGMTNSTSNGATPGQTISNVVALAYGTTGSDDGRLFCVSSTRNTYSIGTDEVTVTNLGALASADAHNIAAPLYYLPSGGYTGGSATAGQLFVSTLNAVQIYY